MLFVKEKLLDYGYSRILIARDRGQGDFEYIDSKLEANFPDVTLRCKKLKPGNYVLFVESGFHTNADS